MNIEEISIGIKKITKERMRQINIEGFGPSHDDEHGESELALAACCYATPKKIYIEDERANEKRFSDPWPFDGKWDKRYQCGECKGIGANYIPNPKSYTDVERIDLLVKAGALIAAEIDRLERFKNEKH
jgi:hypothetical protein